MTSLSEREFIELFERYGPNHVSSICEVSLRGVLKRRRSIEERYGIIINNPNRHSSGSKVESPFVRERETITNGVILVGCDAHYWPDHISLAHKGFVWACKNLSPVLVVMNGDILDGASISRHDPSGWEDLPSVSGEIDACKERLNEIEQAAKEARRYYTIGNHDKRFEAHIVKAAPEYAAVHGFHLADHFSAYKMCYSLWVNDEVVIKHRFKGGVHATHNNTLWSGKTMITGHLHSQKVTPFTDYTGTRYGVDCGTLADSFGPQFIYAEDNPRNWRSGFCVLTFHNGNLLPPELVTVQDERVYFRGGEVCI